MNFHINATGFLSFGVTRTGKFPVDAQSLLCVSFTRGQHQWAPGPPLGSGEHGGFMLLMCFWEHEAVLRSDCQYPGNSGFSPLTCVLWIQRYYKWSCLRILWSLGNSELLLFILWYLFSYTNLIVLPFPLFISISISASVNLFFCKLSQVCF